MNLLGRKCRLLPPRILLLAFSFVTTVLCALSATAHYTNWAWGNRWQPITWLLSMFLLLLACLPEPGQIVNSLKSLLKPRTTFFLFWVLVFVVSHLWRFRTAPWNGNGLFDDSAVDLLFLKNYVIGHPFQPAWFHTYPHPFFISRETLFSYYVWGVLHLFGFNILAYEVALLVLWCGAFIFTLLLVDLLFGSNIVTSVTALIANFLVLSFVYTFVGYRYALTVVLCVASLYFLHFGFKALSNFALSLGGISAGLCLASSLIGKQYWLALLLFAMLSAGLHWKRLRANVRWSSVLISAYGLVVAAVPILCYILFNRRDYTYYESTFLNDFWRAIQGNSPPNDIKHYASHLWNCFFTVPGPRLFTGGTLPIPLPYYFFLLPGFVLAVCQKRYEIPLLGIIPVLGVFISSTGSGTVEHRLLLAIPFWVILMGFTFDRLSRLKLRLALKIPVWGTSGAMVIAGLAPSLQYIDSTTKDPRSIQWFMQDHVAVSRFLKDVVSGQEPVAPHWQRDEFTRITDIPAAPYETFICQEDAYSTIHLFLHDYDQMRILSFCANVPMQVLDQNAILNANKKAILNYVPSDKDLKLIWEKNIKTDSVIQLFGQFRSLGTEESLSYSFGGKERKFYVLNIGNQTIREFQESVRTMPDLFSSPN